MNYKRNRRYFESLNVGALCACAGACLFVLLICVLVGFVFVPSVVFLGYIGIALGVGGTSAVLIYVLVYVCTKPSDAQIDGEYQTLADTAADEALRKVGLSGELKLEIKPVVLSACIFEDIRTTYRLATGKDKKVRSSNFANFVLLFSLEQIITYRSSFSITRQEWRESIQEYYYDDIVTLETQTEVYTVGDSVVHRDVLIVTTSAGTTLELPFENNETAMEAIMTIRKILRAKKRFI